MARITTKGLNDVLTKLKELQDLSRETMGEIIYEGADVMADAIRAEIQALPVTTQRFGSGIIKGVTSVQKAGLLDGFGITPMQERNGKYDVKIGFNGYNKQRTKKYPSGQPNSVIARSVCSGNSFREKNNFVGRAIRKHRKDCLEAMREKATEKINQIMEG